MWLGSRPTSPSGQVALYPTRMQMGNKEEVGTPGLQVRPNSRFELIGLSDSHAGRPFCFTSALSADFLQDLFFILYLKIEGRKRADSQKKFTFKC